MSWSPSQVGSCCTAGSAGGAVGGFTWGPESSFLSHSGKKNKLRVYYLSWLRNRILHNDPEVEKKQGWITVGELEGCVHYKVGTWP